MHFMSQPRYNPRTQRDDWYYRIKESFRDLTGRVRSRVMLNVGFIDEPHRPEDIRDIGKCLTYIHEHQGEKDMFGNPLSRYSEFVQRKSREFWHEMVNNGSIDAVKATMEESREKAERLVDVNTIKHTDAREIGAEWVCLQAIRELEIDKFLRREGWSEIQINTTLAHLITRTIYSPSELKSMRIMDENSAVCELISGNQEWRPGFQSVYKVAPSLYELKDKLENHLCQKTDDLFNITNRIAIFDLTNFYFEGRKDNSKKAQFGRSKEKRSDCKLLVLALCINREGFIRYSSILAGNTADPNSLPDMVDTLNAKTRVPNDPKDKVLVCLDAGIATEDNLQKIKEKGYNYLCVSRRRLTDYEIAPDAKTVTVLDSKKQPIRLTQVKHEEDGDYYLEINSPAKQLKETSMNRKFRERFEEELQKAKDSLMKKNGTKNYEKVIERIGRARQKYPSISKYYVIDYIADDPKNPKNMADIQWRIAVPENVDRQSGIYFLRTNVSTFDEKTTWDYYNLTREIECTNRQLKTDLNLRPIHHKKDDRSDAHLFLGLLSYWIVNTIRYKLKQTGETCFWTEIMRRLSTQKAVTTEATNALGEKVHMRLCSEPNKSANDIYERLKYKKMPFRKIKIEKSL
ncbi:MAG: IS1634 family transposase [Bacteroidales bacterium]|nr:IS1634 family transposase [Candidatus Cryptobacteroides equifaecalis]